MSIFLILKQFVDMFYQFQILDYGMVLLAIGLIGYRVIKERVYLEFSSELCVSDYIVAALGCIYTASFLRYPSAYGIYFKLISCLLIYFLGRLYADETIQNGNILAAVGYIVIYSNFIYRFYQFGYKFIVKGPEETLLNVGGLYYYKTDLAVGIIIATLFIYTFSKKRILCWITILPVAGYMVFYSGARMQKIVFAMIYIIIFLKEIENRRKRNIVFNAFFFRILIGIFIILPIVFFIALQFFPFDIWANEIDLSADWATSALERLMHSRQTVWWDILYYFRERPFWTRLWGIDLETEWMHNVVEVRAHSSYIKQIYATGYAGCFLFVAFVCSILKYLEQEKNRSLLYLVIGLWIMLLGSGLSIESLESTQMSWFPMLFAGVTVSQRRNV